MSKIVCGSHGCENIPTYRCDASGCTDYYCSDHQYSCPSCVRIEKSGIKLCTYATIVGSEWKTCNFPAINKCIASKVIESFRCEAHSHSTANCCVSIQLIEDSGAMKDNIEKMIENYNTENIEQNSVKNNENETFKLNLRNVLSKLEPMLAEKNLAYGNSYEVVPGVMKILYPNGIGVSQLEDALLIVRMLDKLKRIVENNDPMGEDPWGDIAGYALLKLTTREKGK